MATILIVDDRATNRQFLVTLLGYVGHRVLEAADGVEALEIALAEHPDLMIVDIVMPRMDGIEFVRRLRESQEFNSAAIIFYTATYRLSEAQPIADELGIQYLLQKPAAPEVILKTISEALGEKCILKPHANSMAIEIDGELVSLDEIAHQNLNARLAAVIELTFDLVAETNPDVVTLMACQAVRAIVNATYGGVALLEANGKLLRHFASDEQGAAAADVLPTPDPGIALLAPIIEQCRTLRLNAADDSAKDQLEAARALTRPNSPPVQSLLIVPVIATSRTVGWMYVIDKASDGGFTDEDQRICQTLAGFLALAYEKLLGREKELQLTVDLKRSNEELESFAGIVSHDLKSPLRSVKGFAQMLQQDYEDSLEGEAARYLKSIVAGAEQMERCVDDLLQLSRVRDDDDSPVTDVELNLILDQVKDRLYSDIHESGATITCDPLPRVTAYRSQMLQLFQNVIANAIGYHGYRPPVIHVSAEHEPGYWKLSVQDNGIGIETKHLDSIFEVFKRLDTAKDIQGTGLGLAICKKIVVLRGGKIWVESRPGIGSRFCFTLPDTAESAPDTQSASSATSRVLESPVPQIRNDCTHFAEALPAGSPAGSTG